MYNCSVNEFVAMYNCSVNEFVAMYNCSVNEFVTDQDNQDRWCVVVHRWRERLVSFVW